MTIEFGENGDLRFNLAVNIQPAVCHIRLHT